MSDIKAVVFDLDGTLLDTLDDLKNALNYGLSKNGLPERTREEVRRFVGNGVKKLLLRAVEGGSDNPKFQSAFDDFKEYYGMHCKDNTGPYHGIMELLKELKDRGILMAIVSNKYDKAVKTLNEEYFGEFISSAIGEMEGVNKKPAPDTVNKALRELGVKPEEAIYVGDSDVDIMTAKNAGMRCISVDWGFRSVDFLLENGATKIISKPEEILDLI